MKRFTPLILLTLAISGCSKDYTCQCITKSKVSTETKNYSYKHLASKESKTAKTNCEALGKEEAGVTITCTLIKD
jgi:hypothetical protein